MISVRVLPCAESAVARVLGADTGRPGEKPTRVADSKFSVHPTRRISDDDPIARPITFEAMQGARFSGPAPRAVREDERLYINGAFTLAELERIVTWARGPQT